MWLIALFILLTVVNFIVNEYRDRKEIERMATRLKEVKRAIE